MDASRFIEPGGREIRPRSGTGTGSTTLPEDLLREQSIRIQLFYAIGVALWLSNLVLDLYMSPHGDRGPHTLLIEGLGMTLAAGVALFARCGRCSHRLNTDGGVAFIVPHAFLLALLNSWTVQPTTAGRFRESRSSSCCSACSHPPGHVRSCWPGSLRRPWIPLASGSPIYAD